LKPVSLRPQQAAVDRIEIRSKANTSYTAETHDAESSLKLTPQFCLRREHAAILTLATAAP